LMAGSRDALLIACGHFEDTELTRLRSPAEDVAALAVLLADPAVGDFVVTDLVDAGAGAWRKAMEKFFARRSLGDTLLCYISSHGVKDEDGRLYFAASDTEKDWLASTALPASYLRELMDRSRARSIVVVLDCCYSGAFVEGAKGDGSVPVRDELAGRGRAVLTATNATEYSWEGTKLLGEGSPSVFTAAIVEGLRTGAADRDGDGRVSVDDLATYVYERLHDLGSTQTPMRWMSGVADTVYLAHARSVARSDSPVPDSPGPDSPAGRSEVDLLVEAIGIAGPGQREGLVDQLLELGDDRTDLARMLTDRLEAVRDGAAVVLARIGYAGSPALQAFVSGASAESLGSACRALVRVGPDAVPLLGDMLDATTAADRRRQIAAALREIGTLAAIFSLAERGVPVESEPPSAQ
jgi:molecular chaperone DnaJ